MQCPPTRPGAKGRKFHLVRAAASTSQTERSIAEKICAISFMKAMLMSRWAFSITLAASAALIEAARFWAKLTKSDLAGQPHHPQRIYYYYCVHLKLAPQPAFVLDITPYWDVKLAAIAAYHSQFTAGREHESPSMLERLRDEAAYWGKTIGVRYGEPFASREPLGLRSLGGLV